MLPFTCTHASPLEILPMCAQVQGNIVQFTEQESKCENATGTCEQITSGEIRIQKVSIKATSSA